MTAPTPPKKLKFVEAFDKARMRLSSDDQSGYEKVDDMRVLERYFHPVLWQQTDPRVTTQLVTVTLFDFKSFTATITTQPLDRSMNLQGGVDSTLVPFSAFENKDALREAHRALTELGGTPPPLEQITSLDLSTKSPLSAPKTAHFGKKP